MNTAELLAAAEHLVGFIIVILALSVLWGLTAIMGRVIGPMGKSAAKPTAGSAGTVSVPAGSSDDADDELVVISAVVASIFGARHRVVSIRQHPSSWGQQGRREIHASHRIR